MKNGLRSGRIHDIMLESTEKSAFFAEKERFSSKKVKKGVDKPGMGVYNTSCCRGNDGDDP